MSAIDKQIEFPMILHTLDESSSRSIFTVKEMSPDDQPREKMMRMGPEYLSDAELFAILLRSGTREMNALDLSRALLKRFGGLHGMKRKDWNDFKQQRGLGEVKALIVEAALELARRLQKQEPVSKRVFNHAKQIFSEFGPKLAHLTVEQFWVVFLNADKTMISFKQMSVGGRRSTVVDLTEVLRLALLERAFSMILVHNHPSFSMVASRADLQLTENIQAGGKSIGVELDDHVIIAGDRYVSFKESGILPGQKDKNDD